LEKDTPQNLLVYFKIKKKTFLIWSGWRFKLEADRYHFVGNRYRHFQFYFHRYLASRRYSIGDRYRYSKICLPIY